MGYISDMRARIGHDMLMTVGAGVIVFSQGRVLLQRRVDNGCWAMHGGCLEVGEALEDAARRELREETGLIADRLELFRVLSGANRLYTYPNGDQVYMVGVIYICREFHGELRAQAEEVSALEWFPLDALPAVSPPEQPVMDSFVRYIKSGEGSNI